MALGTNNVYTELRTLLVGIDANLSTNGVWEAEHAAMFPWRDKGLPVAALVLPMEDSEDWGATNQSAEIQAEIYYAQELDGPANSLRTFLESVYDALITISYAPSSFQVLGVGPPQYGRQMPPNSPWAEKGATQRTGMVRAHLLIGQQQS